MTQGQDTGRRRRVDDFRLNPDSTSDLYPGADRRRSRARTGQRAPARSFLRRFKQPIIGLSLAGAAAPLINAGVSTSNQPNQPASEAQPTEADLARQAQQLNAAGQPMDAEDVIASRIATEARSSEQGALVETAVSKYDIDSTLAKDIYDAAQKEGISPKLAYGLVKTESSFKARARSGVGARGLTQVMPKTARWLKPGTKADDLWDQKTNLHLGFRYLNQLINKYHGNVHNALTAYNRGPGTVDRILKRGGDPDNGYAGKVLGGALSDGDLSQ
ncbi:MAG TPA: lytic transglycosylase domain-containing protein [Longimicrobiales bacterium]